LQITFTGRHLKLTDSLKDHIGNRIEKFENYFKPIIALHVIMSVVKPYRHSAEMTIQTPDALFSAISHSEDMYASVDLVVEKIKKQLKKHNEKIKKHRKKKHSFRGEMRMNILSGNFQKKSRGMSKTHLPKLVRSEKFAIKPMGIEEAILQLKILGYDFLTFYNASTEKVNVVYKRSDGDLGLIEPEF